MASPDLLRWLHRLAGWGRYALVAVVFALAILVPGGYAVVEQSSKPSFCISCHLMQPYYDSWERSAHGDIHCTECHFEPGTLGTVRGKFQAITQLAKYVTRTQGTRPWADVSDTSCMRGGCHSQAALEGPIAFGRVTFDHGPHLLDVRGQRLRCVTCHSQTLVDKHFAVETSVCFQCHFQPDAEGHRLARTSDCKTCHGPPAEALEVAGRPFAHAEYLARGVECSSCHAGVVAGAGTVYTQRCRSCHGEPDRLALVGDVERMHRAHVTEKKVECFECHVEIQHGREAARSAHPAGDQACAECHDTPHEAARLVFAGAGAAGVASQPSRMFETHVDCAACHTGRSERGGEQHPGLARAGEADCMHCHGTGFAGMLAEWQGAVGQGLASLRPMLDELAPRAAKGDAAWDAAGDAEGDAEAGELLRVADHDLKLLESDGSRGAHNAPFALEVLRSAAGRIDQARARLTPGAETGDAASLLPPPADAACAACHLDVGSHDPIQVHGRPFPHATHLRAAGLQCSECHASMPHGAPAFARDQCASCHHAESETRDANDCAACHAQQETFLRGGAVAGREDAPTVFGAKECTECHGEAPDIVIPTPNVCVLCHEPGYDQKLEAWRTTTAELLGRLQRAVAAAPASAEPASLRRAREALETLAADGSGGVHNAELARLLLEEALRGLGAD